MVSFVNKHLAKFGDFLPFPQFETQVLNAIVEYHYHSEESWILSYGGIEEVVSDFELLQDFYFGFHKNSMAKVVFAFGEIFLSADERKSLLDSTDEEFIYAKVALKLEPLWFLVISMCRILQSDDFRLKAEEAYWLGLVDEAQGSGLPNVRELAERVRKKRSEGEL